MKVMFKRFSIILVLLGFYYQNTFAQIKIIASNTPNSQISAEQFVNFQVSYSGDKSYDVHVKINIRSKHSSNIADIVTRSFKINNGLKSYTIVDAPISQIRFFNKDIESYVRNNGVFPATDYEYCIYLLCSSRDCLNSSIFSETNPNLYSCNAITALNPTPLLLSFPENRAKIKETRPSFTWIPPMPIGSDPEINYTFDLVKIKERQSASAALRRNTKLYKVGQLQFVNLPFPNEIANLETGSKYAWQVVAFLGNTKLQESEVWEFEIVEDQLILSMPFVRLQTADQNSYNALNELKFIYTETSRPGVISFNILDQSGRVLPLQNNKIHVISGENKVTLDLSPFALRNGQKYTIQINASDGTVYPLRFIYYSGL